MSEELIISCDNPFCNGGSHHYFKCNNGHDVCGCCVDTMIHEDTQEENRFCSICIEKALIK